MKKLKEIFAKKKVFMPYLTYGDPSQKKSEAIIIEAIKNGADIIEIGIPFSDPIADGPVIQASHFRALEKNPELSVKDACAFVKKIKKTYDIPIVFMLSVQLVYRFGINPFFKLLASSGVDGAVIPVLSIQEADEYLNASKKHKVGLINLISPLCSPKRLKDIVKKSDSFIYLISSTGTTGEGDHFSPKLKKIVKDIKKLKNIPVLVGFGIHKVSQLDDIYSFADGVVVGSHLVRLLESDPNKVGPEIKKFSRSTR